MLQGVGSTPEYRSFDLQNGENFKPWENPDYWDSSVPKN